jgi:hypothetical protein
LCTGKPRKYTIIIIIEALKPDWWGSPLARAEVPGKKENL